MESYHIEGRVPLRGEYTVKGAKNACLPIMAATVLRPGVHQLYNCPKIGDVRIMEKILEDLGAEVRWEGKCLLVDSRYLNHVQVSKTLMEEMRSSVFLLGSLLARHGEASISKPGGCRIGKRPIDIHINGLEQLGFEICEEGERLLCKGYCQGGRFRLPYPSVGATENLMMAAVTGTSDTIIENCATEPEIADLQGFLRTLGFHVYGAGTDEIFIKGDSSCQSHGFAKDTMYFIMEDRIEAATYMMATLGTGGKVTFNNVRPELLKEVLNTLSRMGGQIKTCENIIELTSPQRLKSPGLVATKPYPGFPTDCQPQLLTLVTTAEGLTTIREEIFESRFTHKKELLKMGADIEICGKNAIIKGINFLRGKELSAADLRGGAALVIAGLMAEGRTVINHIEHIDRGYEDLHRGLQQLGGLIERKTSEEKKKEA